MTRYRWTGKARPNGGLDARSKAEADKRGCYKLSDPQRQRLRGVRTPPGALLHGSGSQRV